MLDIVLAGVTGLVLAVLLSKPARPATPDKDATPTAAPTASGSAAPAKLAKKKWN